ncbi:MAG: adenylate cyclase, partial [Chitinivibrionales bacterium]|nr:adenylate cyclase [Chitinivibrionales bacterium]
KQEQEKSNRLLLNVLPASVADELKENGSVAPRAWDCVTVLFTDFQGFTGISQSTTAQDLVAELDHWFSAFDGIATKHGLEKIKTIGDSYMACAGIPAGNSADAVDAVLAALEIQACVKGHTCAGSGGAQAPWRLRIGIHTGPLVAGVIGKSKFIYDVFGDTVNTARRFESSGEADRINISRATYDIVQPFFTCSYRGKVTAKGKGEMDMYFVERIAPELSQDSEGRVPNEAFAAQRRLRVQALDTALAD